MITFEALSPQTQEVLDRYNGQVGASIDTSVPYACLVLPEECLRDLVAPYAEDAAYLNGKVRPKLAAAGIPENFALEKLLSDEFFSHIKVRGQLHLTCNVRHVREFYVDDRGVHMGLTLSEPQQCYKR